MQSEGQKQRITAALPLPLMQALEQRAAREGRTVSELAQHLLEQHLLEQQPEG